jgi:hypothetical protein
MCPPSYQRWVHVEWYRTVPLHLTKHEAHPVHVTQMRKWSRWHLRGSGSTDLLDNNYYILENTVISQRENGESQPTVIWKEEIKESLIW